MLFSSDRNTLSQSECKLQAKAASLGFCKTNPGLVSILVSFDLKVVNPFTLVSGKYNLSGSTVCQ